MKRTKRMKDPAETLYCIIICILMLGYGFAAGVWAGENLDEHPEQKMPEVIWVKAPKAEETAVVDTSSVTADAATPSPQGEGFPDPMIEDTYLMPEHPLPLDLQVKLYGACLEMGVDYELAVAVIDQETDFRNLMGDGGKAYGYFQIWPKWHQDRMAELGVTDLMDPESNFRVGCHFLAECIDKYGLEAGLGYYNSGKAAANKYSREVLEVYYG